MQALFWERNSPGTETWNTVRNIPIFHENYTKHTRREHPFCAPFSGKGLTFEIQKLYNFCDESGLFLINVANPLQEGDAKL